MTINGPAQAGSDAFNLAAGDGSAPARHAARVSPTRHLLALHEFDASRRRLRDERINHLAFTADLAIWVDERGKLTRARVLRSTGDPKIDSALVEDYEGTAFDQPPPTTLRFPQRITVHSRRPA